jgi:hypothetical protein
MNEEHKELITECIQLGQTEYFSDKGYRIIEVYSRTNRFGFYCRETPFEGVFEAPTQYGVSPSDSETLYYSGEEIDEATRQLIVNLANS